MKRNYFIDIMKFILSLFVIMIHVNPFTGTMNFIVWGVISRLAVPFFFLLSGYFLSKKIDNRRTDSGEIVFEFLTRISKRYIFWFCLYLIFMEFSWKGYGLVSSHKNKFVVIFIEGALYHLWFLPALIFGTAFVFYLREKFSTKTLIIIAAVLYFVGLSMNSYAGIFSDINHWKSVSSTFLYGRNGLMVGFPLIFAGTLIERNVHSLKRDFLYFALTLNILFLEVLFVSRTTTRSEYDFYLSLPFVVFFLLKIVLNFRIESKEGWPDMGAISSLNYLAHPMFYYSILKLATDYSLTSISSSGWLIWSLTTSSTLLFSYLLVRISKKKYFVWIQEII